MTEAGPRAVALVTGASRGIGAAIARRLAADGWSLSLGMRNPQAPEGLADAHLHRHDCFEADEAAWVEAARAQFGRIDAVVACAGIMTPKSVIEVEDDALDAMWEVNVKSPRRLIRAAWPDLCQTGRGRVVVVASLSGKRVKTAGSAAYAMTKHAAVALSHGVRQAGWEHGVRATAICPGYVATDMTGGVKDFPREEMTEAESVADLAALALSLPNNACMAEMHVNCRIEEFY